MSRSPPPEYFDAQSILSTCTSIDDDGRFSIDVRQRSRRFGNIFASSSRDFLDNYSPLIEDNESTTFSHEEPVVPSPPKLNIVIQIVGSRGDVQPFVALGCSLKEFGHRVRLATHSKFKGLVEAAGLEFFNIGGNPEELMAFMVKNPGLIPSYATMRDGDLQVQRQNMADILHGCWRSCIETGNGMSSSEDENGINPYPTISSLKPFVADAIIANPPSFAHIHCAERLGVPLHLMFTMPYSPTEAFPHPLVKIRKSDLGSHITNRLSYAMIERLIWHGLGDVLNKFRESTLDLEPLNIMMAAGLLTRLKVPYTYCWSSHLLRKPRDWGSHIAVSGFFFQHDKSEFTPPPDLVKFIENGDQPIYIGFGSIVVGDPEAMTSMVLDAVNLAGVRALVSKGWSNLGQSGRELPETVYLLDDIPHTWLFQHVSAVVHHGGAGTTAAGLYAGKPTVVVPFFGDQTFWGGIVAGAGAGPLPMPFAMQTAETLAQQIRDALHPELKIRARHLGLKIQNERGCENGMMSFHRSLNFESSTCSITDRLAVWKVTGRDIRLSAVSAVVLLEHGLLRHHDLEILRHQEYLIEDRPIDPISGGASAFLGSFGDIMYQTYDLGKQITKASRKPGAGGSNMSVDQQQHILSASNMNEGSSCSLTTEHVKENVASVNKSTLSHDSLGKAKDISLAAVAGIGKLSKACLTTPLYFTMGIARGFQNIPIAYGDITVRQPEKVDGIQTGLRVAISQFSYGFYDGIYGVVKQPLDGARTNGALGLVTGLGKGIGGLILKPGAGIFGLPAYALLGISQEMRGIFGSNYEKHIMHSRFIQGQDEMQSCSPEERQHIVSAWTCLSQENSGTSI